MYNSVEQELWRIFTFYSLHGDPNQPEIMRPANFLRFAKDCQITSKKLTPTQIELEITRLTRSKEISGDYNPSLSINFQDFLQLLDAISQKMYSRDAPELAIKRLLLENVLLFASRRVPQSDSIDLSNAEANRVVREVYGKCLMKIFDYYLDRADKRRNSAVSAEKMQQKDLRNLTPKDLSSSFSVNKTQTLQQLKEQVRAQKSLIGYREYIQFCYDFNLKSTSLLTAIQVGEIFLNVVPLNSTEISSKAAGGSESLGMTFEHFLRSLLYMAFIAYRDSPPSVTPPFKMKALLLYMWKAVNDSDKTSRLVSNNRNNTLTHFAGSLNIFGSGMFSDLFLSNWMKDGFPDYSAGNDGAAGLKTGSMMVKSVVHGNAVEDYPHDLGESTAVPTSSPSHKPQQHQQQSHHHHSSSSGTVAGMNSILDSMEDALTLAPTPMTRRTNSIYVTPFQNTVRARHATNVDATASNGLDAMDDESGPRVIQGVVEIEGEKLALLLRQRPELAEFLALEIQNMKLQSDSMGSALMK